ncbi:MAG: HD domain-containing protein [Oscillospiraceae bacterium]|nr:HD domain-containing protein [Oscillospiraceae bacterium]
MITREDIKNNEAISALISRADETLLAMGYTEHAFAHVTKCAHLAAELLGKMGYPERECELAWIAGYLHDIGNVINRQDHAHNGALMTFQLLGQLGMSYDEIGIICAAIGHHDEETAIPVNSVAAALILADKSDVRRSRVRNRDTLKFGIHDRVNYAVEESNLTVNTDTKDVSLVLAIDTNICPLMEYFEIFLGRMLLCRRAANYLGYKFHLDINHVSVL